MNGPGVYFIQLDEPLCTKRRAAFYYFGSASDMDKRLEHYKWAKNIRGNIFLREARRRGISFRPVYFIPTATAKEARQLEARLKRQHKSGRHLMRGGVAV